MTTKELSKLYYLSKEITENREELARLKAIANGTTAQMTGMPGVAGAKDKLGKVMADILDTQAILDRNLQKYWHEYNRLTQYIASIDDSLMRQIIKHRYKEQDPWDAVASKIGWGKSTDALKKKLYRFLDKR